MKTIRVSDNLHKWIMNHKNSEKPSAEKVIYGLVDENDTLKKTVDKLLEKTNELNNINKKEVEEYEVDKTSKKSDQQQVLADQQIMDKEEIEKNPEVTNQQVIQIEIERLVTSLKHHHCSLSEIRMFIKNSLVTINKDNTTRGIQSLTLDELSEIVKKEAENQGIHCVE